MSMPIDKNTSSSPRLTLPKAPEKSRSSPPLGVGKTPDTLSPPTGTEKKHKMGFFETGVKKIFEWIARFFRALWNCYNNLTKAPYPQEERPCVCSEPPEASQFTAKKVEEAQREEDFSSDSSSEESEHPKLEERQKKRPSLEESGGKKKVEPQEKEESSVEESSSDIEETEEAPSSEPSDLEELEVQEKSEVEEESEMDASGKTALVLAKEKRRRTFVKKAAVKPEDNKPKFSFDPAILLARLTEGYIHENLFSYFEEIVPKEARNSLYEKLGGKEPYTWNESLMTWSKEAIKDRNIRVGRAMVETSPTLAIPILLPALKRASTSS